MTRGEGPGRDDLFDRAAESMVLFDASDAESGEELKSAFGALRGYFGDIPDGHPLATACDLVDRLCDGDASVIAELEKAYVAARGLPDKPASSAAPPESSAKPEDAPESPKRANRKSPPKPEVEAPSQGAKGREAAKPAAAQKAMPLAGDADLLRDFGVRANEHLDDADQWLLSLESNPDEADAVDAVFRAFHTIKGMAGFLALDDISQLSHSSESLLSDVRAGTASVERDLLQSLFAAVDEMRSLVAVASGVQRAIPAAEKTGASTNQAIAASSAREGTVRIEEGRLDALLDTIGEMVIAESMVSASLHSGEDASLLAARVERLDKISRELQQMATALRMVPLKMTFARMSRLVRDVAHKAGKQVEFVVHGEDTEIDKTVAERLSDPLIHALRNAVDHGIESPSERRAAGKPEVGQVELRAFHSGGAVHVEVSDDGRGLSLEKIHARACERGLIEQSTVLSDQQLSDLVFEPGFSTAETVTDVSGRGVGMDVVRRTIEELRGRVGLSTRAGGGTTLSIRLPVTLAIIDGMVVRVGKERYVIPVLSIERSVRPSPDEISTVKRSGLMLRNNERMIPVLPLHHHLGVKDAERDPTKAVVVIINDGGVSAGLLVCELLGQQQTVIKPLGEGLPHNMGVAGAAIMPDGEVGLILDAAGLVRLANGACSE